MRGSKGFTLVELLAVLVILAIIALITTPIILGVIDDARESAAEDKTWAYVDAIENAFAINQTKTDAVTLPYPSAGTTASVNGKVGNEDIRVSGDKATGGTFTINEEGEVSITGLKLADGYTCSTTGNNSVNCTK